MKIHKHEKLRCPKCYASLNASTNVDGATVFPRPGDVSICAHCLELLEYQEDMSFASIDITTLQPDVQRIVLSALTQAHTFRR